VPHAFVLDRIFGRGEPRRDLCGLAKVLLGKSSKRRRSTKNREIRRTDY
jgi:hypothetical protein